MNEQNESAGVTKSPQLQTYAMPLAIVFGFGLIALAIFFSGNNKNAAIPGSSTGGKDTQIIDTNVEDKATINPVTEEDHIRGNLDAPIKLVEYSDFDCPFCKQFHETMSQIYEEYADTGKVAWVYRQFPLQQLHPNAPAIAEASECVAELGGNDAFWIFADKIFNEREVNELTNMALLPSFAEASGVSTDDFTACLESGRNRSKVEEDFNNGSAIGARGTPYTVVMVGERQGVINGAQPYSNVKQVVDGLLNQLGE